MTRLDRMRDIVVIDFESYWAKDYTLSKMTTSEYVRDPRYQTVGVSVIYRGRRVWMEHAQFQQFVYAWNYAMAGDRTGIVCHHTHFDGLIMAERYGMQPPVMWFDTLSMSRAYFGAWAKHGLEQLAPRCGAGEKMDTIYETLGMRREDMTTDFWNRYGAYSINDSVITGECFRYMLPGFPRKELLHIDMTVRMFTEPAFVLDEPLCQQVQVDELQRKSELLTQLRMDQKELASTPKFCRALTLLGVDIDMKPGKHGEIPAVAKSDPFMQNLLESGDDDIRILAEARIAVKSTLNFTRASRFLRLGRDGQRLPVYICFSKAHTHRWAGGDSINWQNLERTDKRNPKKGRIRKAVCAPAGSKVVVRDSSQIEARFTGWLSGESALVSAFAQGRDIYSEQASKCYKRQIDRKKNKEDEIPGHVGKVQILGLGYGMGYLKLALELLKGAFGGPPVQFTAEDIDKLGVNWRDFTEDKWKMERLSLAATRLDRREMLAHAIVCDYLVEQYRSDNARVSGYWKFLEEEVFPRIANGEEEWFGPTAGDPQSLIGGRAFKTEKGAILLPSGLRLFYRDLRQHSKKWIYDTERGVRNLYGGKALENISQADCRIIVADQLGVINERYPIRLMTHDEGAIVVPDSEAPIALAFMGQEMKKSPWWAPGLPLASEGGFAQTYGDAK